MIHNSNEFTMKEEQYLKSIIKSVGVKRAEEELSRVKQLIDKEKELFLSNIPYNRTARDLVEILCSNLGSTDIVVRCQTLEKNRMPSGCALILVRSESHVKTLLSANIIIDSRKINIKLGSGGSKQHRRIESKEEFRFDANSLSIGIPRDIDNKTSSIRWSQQDGQKVKLTINGPKQSIMIQANLEEGERWIEVKFNSITELDLVRDDESNDLILSFHLRYAPRISKEKPSLESMIDDIFGKMFSISSTTSGQDRGRRRGGGGGSSLWEAALSLEDQHGELTRTVEEVSSTTSSGYAPQLFGLYLQYHVNFGNLIKDSEKQRLICILQDYALLKISPNKIMNIHPMKFLKHTCTSSMIQAVHTAVWSVLSARGLLPWSTLYWLHVLLASNKIDFYFMNQYEDIHGIAEMLIKTKSYERDLILKHMHSQVYRQFTFHFQYTFKQLLLRDEAISYEIKLYEQENDIAPEVEQADDDDNGDGLIQGINKSLRVTSSDDNTDDNVEEEQGGTIQHHVIIRHVLITPLRICPQPPDRELSSSVIRHFEQHIDRFIRVQFVDENFGFILQDSSEDIFELRIRPVMMNGINIGGHHFQFLAFSNSQVREQSCWFYSESATFPGKHKSFPTAQSIRNWIGDLSSINIVGKFAARLGQGFSTTAPVPILDGEILRAVRYTRDVTVGSNCFSDGVGMITDRLSKKIAEQLNIYPVPSAYQIRYGGCKGMLTVVPDSRFHQPTIVIRDSMKKFPSSDPKLGINRYSKAIPMYLNRQLIAILSTRGIKDVVFLQLLKKMTNRLDAAVEDEEVAKQILLEHGRVEKNESSTNPSTAAWFMLDSGLDVKKDIFLQGILQATRNYLLLGLETKARIYVPNGIVLMGVMDETNTLEEGQIFFQLSNRYYQIQANHGIHHFGKRCLVGRNPSLHPGDLRLLTNIYRPELSYLFDVVVFPSKGSRPHCNEMSGGDLDGDLYFITWDPLLQPATDYLPMDYSSSSEIPEQKDNINIQDIANFFVNYMKNDNLGRIATAHMVFADLSVEGVQCSQCLLLAKLHSTAVDFVKTNIPASYPKELVLQSYPHFMDNSRKSSHKSTKVLGRIYDICKDKRYRGNYEYYQTPIIMDKALLVDGFEAYIKESQVLLDEYNYRLWGIMSHYDIRHEGELLSGCVLNLSKLKRPHGGRRPDEMQKKVSAAVQQLWKHFRQQFFDCFEVDDDMSHHDTSTTTTTEQTTFFSSYETIAITKPMMQQASAWYYCAYQQQEASALYSFPWVMYPVLCRIKLGRQSDQQAPN
jgi:hypothetical protein